MIFTPERYSVAPSGQIASAPSSYNAAVAEAKSAAEKLPGMGETTSLIAQKIVAHAAPLVQNDHALQQRVGSAVGSAVSDRLAAPAWIAAIAITAAAGAVLYKTLK
jgi:hypothetical protein